MKKSNSESIALSKDFLEESEILRSIQGKLIAEEDDDEDAFGGGSDSDEGGFSDGSEEKKEDSEREDPYDLEGHEDDPRFLKGIRPDSPADSSPSGNCIYNTEDVMKALETFKSVHCQDVTIDWSLLDRIINIISAGKLVKQEDFSDLTNPESFSSSISEILRDIDLLTYNYYTLSIREVLDKVIDELRLEVSKSQSQLAKYKKILFSI